MQLLYNNNNNNNNKNNNKSVIRLKMLFICVEYI